MTCKHAQSFWSTGDGCGEIRREALPAPGAGDVLVRALYSGISRGSEALVFRGEVPPSEHARMRAPFQSGDLPGPVKYGYASVGRVEHGPPELAGRTAFCLHPHQTSYVVPAEAVHPLPEAVPAARAVLAANLETAVNALWDARPGPGDRIAVVGAGTVGCLSAWLAARVPGCEVQLVDPRPARAEVAARLGCDFAAPQAARGEADLVLHASGSAQGLATALELTAFEATVVELSWFGTQHVPLALGAGFHARRLTIRSSQVGHVPPARRARWTRARRLALALRLLAEPALDDLITGESPFASLPEVMARLARDPGDTLCHRIRYERPPAAP